LAAKRTALGPAGSLTSGQTLELVVLTTLALVATALVLAYLLERRGAISTTVVGDYLDAGGGDDNGEAPPSGEGP
jgi:hypothetical protein